MGEALVEGDRGEGTSTLRDAQLHLTRPYSWYLHTHSPAGRKSVPLFRLESQGSITKKKPIILATSKKTANQVSKLMVFVVFCPFCRSEVELGDGPLAAAVGQLVGDALAVALQLGKVLVKDLARAQG